MVPKYSIGIFLALLVQSSMSGFLEDLYGPSMYHDFVIDARLQPYDATKYQSIDSEFCSLQQDAFKVINDNQAQVDAAVATALASGTPQQQIDACVDSYQAALYRSTRDKMVPLSLCGAATTASFEATMEPVSDVRGQLGTFTSQAAAQWILCGTNTTCQQNIINSDILQQQQQLMDGVTAAVDLAVPFLQAAVIEYNTCINNVVGDIGDVIAAAVSLVLACLAV